MNRKNTILLAVLINAGLLLVLFVTALSSKDETSVAAPAAKPPVQEAIPSPLFGGDEVDLALRHPSTPLSIETPVAVAEPGTAPVVHALPPLAVETPPPASVAVLPAPTPASAPAAQTAPREVTVKKGDSLDKIAKAYGTSVEELLKLNHLSSSFLRVGQQIRVPQAGAKSPKAVASQPETKAAEYYVVKVGDTPWTIAMKHHLKVEELLKLNALNEKDAKRLKAGDRLRIR